MNGFPNITDGEEAPVQPWKKAPLFWVYAVGGVLCMILAWLCFQQKRDGLAIMFAVFGVLGLQLVIRLIRKRPEEFIPLQAITRLRYINGTPPVSKAYFIVYFTRDNGRKTHKLIVLPGTKREATQEREIAFALFEDRGIPIEE